MITEIIKRNGFISPRQILKLVETPEFTNKVIPLDSSWFLPNSPRNAKAEFEQERLPGAVFFDIDQIKDEKSPYPHMMPSTLEFNKHMSSMGLSRDNLLVVYDSVGQFSGPRAHWMLRAFEHPQTVLLNSFPAYKKYGGPLISGPFKESVRSPTKYSSPGLAENSLILYEELVKLVTDPHTKDTFYLVDARPAGRFSGADPEPRPELSSGHIPGAISIPFSSLMNDQVFQSNDKISNVFEQKGVGKDKPIILMCGTGVTACILEAGLRESGYTNQDIRVYDGSWTEWAQRADPGLIVKDV